MGNFTKAPFPETNMSEMWDLFNHTNTITSPTGGHYFGDFMVVIVWLIVFGIANDQFARNSLTRALMVSSFIAFFWAVLLDTVGIVDQSLVILPFVVMSISATVDMLMRKN